MSHARMHEVIENGSISLTKATRVGKENAALEADIIPQVSRVNVNVPISFSSISCVLRPLNKICDNKSGCSQIM